MDFGADAAMADRHPSFVHISSIAFLALSGSDDALGGCFTLRYELGVRSSVGGTVTLRRRFPGVRPPGLPGADGEGDAVIA